MSPGDIRDEVARGARFVMYHYCISIVVMTFKRPSNVHFIKPGEGRILKGLPCCLVSLLLGWWGIPWGPIYTIETLVNNLLGGKDVTDQIMASLAGAQAGQAPGAGPAPAQPPEPAAAAVEPSRGARIAVGIALVAVLLGAVVGSICFYRSTRLTVVLVSGAPSAYSVDLDGVPQQLVRGHPLVLTRPEGRFVVTCNTPGVAPATQTFEFALPFLDHLFESRVAVINPDGAAILFRDTMVYYPVGTAHAPGGIPEPAIYANERSYFLPSPDYMFTDFPRQVKMPRDASRATRTRLAQLTLLSPGRQASFLLSRLGYAAMRRHLELLAAQQPEDEALLEAASSMLKPGDGRAWFERHLGDRPVLIEWHRYYQHFMEDHFPDMDLSAQYRGLLAAEPDNGAYMYLLGRLCADPAEMRAMNEKAVAAAKPCYYGYNGLGFLALNEGDFARALECFNAAGRNGIKSAALAYSRRAARLALGDFEGLLADAAARRKAAPGDLAAAKEEITCALMAGKGKDAAGRIKAELISQMTRTLQPGARERGMLDAVLSAAIAYGTRDATAYAREMGRLATPDAAFQAAVSLGDHVAAAAALKKIPERTPTAHLMCYLVARLKGDDGAADAYFSQAVEAMANGGRDLRMAAALLRKPEPPPIAALDAILFYPAEKRVLMAALALRYPGNRAEFLEGARRMNFEPEFPRLLIDQVIGGAGR